MTDRSTEKVAMRPLNGVGWPAALLLALGLALLPVLARAEDWPLFRGNPARTGAGSGTPATGDTAIRLWEFRTGGAVTSSPAVANGRVYFGSADRGVYAADAATGEQVWVVQTGGPVSSSPAVVGNAIYVGTATGLIRIFEQPTGAPLQTSLFAGSPVDSSPVVTTVAVPTIDGSAPEDEIVFFGARDGFLHAVRTNGTGLLWSRPVNSGSASGVPVFSSPAIADGPDGKLVVIGGQDALVVFNAADGAERGRMALNGQTDSAPAITNGFAFIAGSGGAIHALPLAAPAASCGSWPAGGALFSSPALHDTSLFIATEDGLLALQWNAVDGRCDFGTLWKSPGDARPKGLASSPAVSGGRVYVGDGVGVVHAFDEASGTEIWSFATPNGSPINSSPAVVSGVVYVGSADGFLYALQETTASQQAA